MDSLWRISLCLQSIGECTDDKAFWKGAHSCSRFLIVHQDLWVSLAEYRNFRRSVGKTSSQKDFHPKKVISTILVGTNKVFSNGKLKPDGCQVWTLPAKIKQWNSNDMFPLALTLGKFFRDFVASLVVEETGEMCGFIQWQKRKGVLILFNHPKRSLETPILLRLRLVYYQRLKHHSL